MHVRGLGAIGGLCVSTNLYLEDVKKKGKERILQTWEYTVEIGGEYVYVYLEDLQ